MDVLKVFDYIRKSQEDEDRQMLSFENQANAIQTIPVPTNSTFEIINEYREKKSGKIPKARDNFNAMMDRIDKGEAQGIRCWKVHRLARNPVDGGRIIWAVQMGMKIYTPTKTYAVSDIDSLYGEFSRSHTFINDLRENTMEGTKTKLSLGKAPLKAPIGYRNTPEKPQGMREIQTDQDRFPLIRKMWELLLTGKHNPNQILTIATKEWGLRQKDGRPLKQKQIYKLFTNIFYTGKYYSYAGQLHDNGIHEPMISLSEFELAQRILGSRGKPFNVQRDFAFTNWITCVCGSAVTAEERLRRYCFKCKGKFNAETNEICPKCKKDLSPNIIYTVTYHCGRKKGPCNQPSISLNNLEMQIDMILESLELPEEYVQWTLEMLKKENEKEIIDRQSIGKSLHDAVVGIDKRLDNLAYKFSSPENVNGDLYTDAEYVALKNKLKAEKLGLETELQKQNLRQDTWMDNAEKAFNFVIHSRYWFKNGTKDQKRAIFQAISSNPVLENRLVRVSLLKPFEVIQNIAKMGNVQLGQFEPRKQPQAISAYAESLSGQDKLYRVIDEVRTSFQDTQFIHPIPSYHI